MNQQVRAASAASEERDITIGVVLMAAAMLLLPLLDAAAKDLATRMVALQVAGGRFLFQMLFALPLAVALHGLPSLLPRPLGLQTLRGLMHAGSNVAFVAALTVMPLADAVALVFVAPLMVTAMSAVLLRERVGPRRWLAVIVGLIGAVIIIRPGSGLFGIGAILPIIAAAFFAVYLIVTRRLAGAAPPFATHFFTGLSATGAIAVILLIGLVTDLPHLAPSVPSAWDWTLLAFTGLVSTVAHYLILIAYSRAPASVLAPMGYVEIIGAVAIGYLVFDEFPDLWTFVGVGVIAAAGIYVVLRERAVRRQPPPPVALP